MCECEWIMSCMKKHTICESPESSNPNFIVLSKRAGKSGCQEKVGYKKKGTADQKILRRGTFWWGSILHRKCERRGINFFSKSCGGFGLAGSQHKKIVRVEVPRVCWQGLLGMWAYCFIVISHSAIRFHSRLLVFCCFPNNQEPRGILKTYRFIVAQDFMRQRVNLISNTCLRVLLLTAGHGALRLCWKDEFGRRIWRKMGDGGMLDSWIDGRAQKIMGRNLSKSTASFTHAREWGQGTLRWLNELYHFSREMGGSQFRKVTMLGLLSVKNPQCT